MPKVRDEEAERLQKELLKANVKVESLERELTKVEQSARDAEEAKIRWETVRVWGRYVFLSEPETFCGVFVFAEYRPPVNFGEFCPIPCCTTHDTPVSH